MARAPALQAGGQGFDSLVFHESGRESSARFFDRMGKRKQTQRRDTHELRRHGSAAANKTSESEKRGKAHGGCLGSRRRGRTRQAAKVCGEARTAVDPQVSEWGNPPCAGTASP